MHHELFVLCVSGVGHTVYDTVHSCTQYVLQLQCNWVDTTFTLIWLCGDSHVLHQLKGSPRSPVWLLARLWQWCTKLIMTKKPHVFIPFLFCHDIYLTFDCIVLYKKCSDLPAYAIVSVGPWHTFFKVNRCGNYIKQFSKVKVMSLLRLGT